MSPSLAARAALLSLLLAAACAAEPSGASPTGVDGGRSDVGAPDAGVPDAAAVLDAGAPDAGPGEVDPSCQRPGCLRSVSQLGRWSRAELQPFLQVGVTIDNGYSLYAIRFRTEGADSLATVAIPYEPGLVPPPGGWPIVANNHGTMGLEDPCAITGTDYGAGLAGLFGARGAIGVAVDYPGLGTPGLHPYLVLRSEGTAVLDGLRAARALAERLGVPTSGRMAAVGVSQGGHATLAAASLHAAYAPELDLRGFGVTAPGSAWAEHFSAAAAFDGPHWVFLAMVIHAWAVTDGATTPSPWAPALAPELAARLETACLIDLPGVPSLLRSFPQRAAEVLGPDALQALRSRRWGAYAALGAAFERNRIRPFSQTAPVLVYQGDADTTVLEPDTRALVEALRAGGVDVDYRVVPGGGHLDVAFGYVAFVERRTAESLAWIRARLSD